jgi:hypothetical protein
MRKEYKKPRNHLWEMGSEVSPGDAELYEMGKQMIARLTDIQDQFDAAAACGGRYVDLAKKAGTQQQAHRYYVAAVRWYALCLALGKEFVAASADVARLLKI